MEGGKVLDTSSAKTKEDRKEEGANLLIPQDDIMISEY
jgi:hypothetical protein